MRLIGYARVSTGGQSLEGQIDQLTSSGCERIYKDTASGARDDRPQLNRLLRELQPDDVVLVTRTDRLARSVFGLFAIVQRITGAGASFRSLSEPAIDTASAMGRVVLAVMGALADVERDLIKTRTGEGRARARARGVKMGRPPRLNVEQRAEAAQRLSAGEPVSDVARTFAVGKATLRRLRRTLICPQD